MKPIIKCGITLFGICLVAAFCLGFVSEATKGPILDQQIKAFTKFRSEYFNDSTDSEELPIKEESTVSKINLIKKGDETIGYIVEANPNGFGGAIKMVIAIDKDISVKGYDILDNSETPDYGKDFETDEQLKSRFKGKKAPLKTSQEPTDDPNLVQTKSGATITTDAIVGAINDALNSIK